MKNQIIINMIYDLLSKAELIEMFMKYQEMDTKAIEEVKKQLNNKIKDPS